MNCRLTFASLIVFSLILAPSFCGITQAQAQHSLYLQGVTWGHSTIGVLVVPQEDASWWSSSYLSATLRSISQWNNAIQDFALNFTDSNYLSGLRMVPTVSRTLSHDSDVCVSWIQAFSGNSEEIGLAETTYNSFGIIINSTISLAAQDSNGNALNEIDMQNLALHELGHSLALGHSDYSGDVMYPRLASNQTVQALSTLDLYGVSTVFHWMSDSPSSPHSPEQSSVTLPLDVAYQYLPISYDDLPPPGPSPVLPSNLPQTLFTCVETLLTYILRFFLNPLILIPLLVGIAALLFIKFGTARVTRKSTRESV